MRANSDFDRMRVLFNSRITTDWLALGAFCARLRQCRRTCRTKFAQIQQQRLKRGFSVQKAAWRARGNWVCRHGVFFTSAQDRVCPCLDPFTNAQDFQHARWMPSLDSTLKFLVTAPFSLESYRRLGKLQAEMRRALW